MKYFFAFLSLFFIAYSNAQIPEGEYFSYGISTHFISSVTFLPDNHIQLITGEDTIGGVNKEKNGKVIAAKYVIDTTKTPNYLDVIVYNKSNGEIQEVLKGLIARPNRFMINIAGILSGDERPKDFMENDGMIIKLTLNCPENYINNLKINEREGASGFKPETKEIEIAKGIRKITYLLNGKPLKAKDFQTKEICEYDKNDQLVKRTLFDAKNSLYVNELGFCKEQYGYDNRGQLVLFQRFKNAHDLMTYNGGFFYPQVKYIYNDDVLIQVDRLINNEEYRTSVPTTLKFRYDSYGDQLGMDSYYADGTKKNDSLTEIAIMHFTNWINNFAKYPKSFEPLIYGNVNVTSAWENTEKVPNSETYEIYAEFLLDDTANTQTKFTGFFQFDFEFNLKYITYKSKKTGNSGNFSWNSDDTKKWIVSFCRALTAEEIKKIENTDEQLTKEFFDTLIDALKDQTKRLKDAKK